MIIEQKLTTEGMSIITEILWLLNKKTSTATQH
jgi:hypothetical protein